MYFGLDRKKGLPISNVEFGEFLDERVTPKFPDGLTVLNGYGQWRVLGSYKPEGEACKILILVVETWENAEVQRKVYDIRNSYGDNYGQESVLVTVSALHEVSF